MWTFKAKYCYYKMVTQHFYGLCGVTIEYRKLKDNDSAIKSMMNDFKMQKLGFHVITKEEYEANNEQSS